MNKLIILLVVLFAAGCKEKFISPAPPVSSGYLVMEGIVNDGGGITNIRLSRTTSLNNGINKHEDQATVKIEGSDNSSISFSQNAPGNYTISNLHLDPAIKYRLSVKTSNNEEYLSDFVTVRPNPPIDSISWERENDGVHIFINTHNPQKNTLYYQWEHDETWEFHSAYYASLKYIKAPPPYDNLNIAVGYRGPSDPEIYTCWQFNSSSAILLGSSAKLSEDIIHLPIVEVPAASWKISVLYSILVKQYAWSKEGYEFLERMKKNTETVGSVFDAQPSELNGNIHCTSNPALQAIGFFNICTIRENRIFIKNSALPGWGFQNTCQLEIIENLRDSIKVKGLGKLPVYPDQFGPFGSITTFFASSEQCVDCRLTGTNLKPIYWP
ncbi:MAG: DUF4249 domain-containing protein [Ferruginibacter sp.]